MIILILTIRRQFYAGEQETDSVASIHLYVQELIKKRLVNESTYHKKKTSSNIE